MAATGQEQPLVTAFMRLGSDYETRGSLQLSRLYCLKDSGILAQTVFADELQAVIVGDDGQLYWRFSSLLISLI